MRTDDGSIIQECLDGKPGAFGMLVDKYKAGIYAFVYTELRNFHDAQDVTQEVFLQAYRGLRNLRRWESFSFWLYRIARNLCKKWVRSQSRRPDSEFIADQDRQMMDFPSTGFGDGSQMSESLREALDALSVAYREVLMLHYFGGMSIKDMAKAVGASPRAIGMRLSRARIQLKEEMVAMMDTAFEGQRLQANFTFRVVEAVKRIKINPMPRMAAAPWGLALAAGIVVAVLSLNPQMSMTSDIVIPAGSPLLVESKVLKTGEIPVDILDFSRMSLIVGKKGDDDGGKPQQIPMLAPQQDESGKWTEKADMPTSRNLLNTAILAGKIYAIGGWNHQMGGEFSVVEEYDPAMDSWTEKASMPNSRVGFAIAAVGGEIYVIGGGSNALSTVYEYDPDADVWTKKANMPTPRTGLSASVVDEKIYVIGGGQTRYGPSFPNVEEYDPAADAWIKKADMPTPRVNLSTAAVNGRIYAIGGDDGNKTLNTTEEYNPATDTWARKTDMPTARAISAIAVLDQRIYVIGGVSRPPWDGGVMANVEIYDPATDTWTQGIDMPTARAAMSASVMDGRIYVIGGWKPGMYFSTVEEYDTGFVPEGTGVEPEGKLPTKWGEIKSD